MSCRLIDQFYQRFALLHNLFICLKKKLLQCKMVERRVYGLTDATT